MRRQNELKDQIKALEKVLEVTNAELKSVNEMVDDHNTRLNLL